MTLKFTDVFTFCYRFAHLALQPDLYPRGYSFDLEKVQQTVLMSAGLRIYYLDDGDCFP